MAYTQEQIDNAYAEICNVSLSLGITETEMKNYLKSLGEKKASEKTISIINRDLESIILKLQSLN